MPTKTKKSIGSYQGVDIYEGSQADINSQVAAVNSSDPLTSSSLAPQRAMTVPQQTAPTSSTGFQGYLETQADQFTQNLEAQTKQREANAGNSFESLIAGLNNSTGQAQLQSQADKTLQPLEAELQDINNQMLAEQEGLRRQVEAIQKNPGISTIGERDRLVGEAQRTSLRKQADLAIIQLSKQGKFDSARAVADRAIAAQLEAQAQKIETLKFIYSENKDLFTKAEQRQFEVMQGDRERALQNEEYRLRAAFDQKIRQNDPLYQAQLGKIYSEIAENKAKVGIEGNKAQLKLQNRVSTAETVLNKVAQATAAISGPTGALGRSGFVGGLASNVPGTNAYQLRRTLDTIKANLGFEELQAMREASPTGGALGQVAVQELTMLQATISALDTGLDGETLRNNLNEVRTHYTNWLNTVGYSVAPNGDVVEIID